METNKTQFMMSGVLTDVTVQQTGEATFACTLNLADFFDGGEFEGGGKEPDITIKQSENGTWEIIGDKKITLSDHDVQNLGKAIDTII